MNAKVEVNRYGYVQRCNFHVTRLVEAEDAQGARERIQEQSARNSRA